MWCELIYRHLVRQTAILFRPPHGSEEQGDGYRQHLASDVLFLASAAEAVGAGE